MRLIAFFLLLFIGFGADARVLHVDNNTIKLSQTKTTSPALHIKVDGGLWYGKMDRCSLPMNQNTDKELRIKHNGTDYWVSDIDDYIIRDGKLIAANCNIYLEDIVLQRAFIDTLFFPNQDTAIQVKIWSNGIDTSFFGAREGLQNNTFGFMCTSAGYARTDYNKTLGTLGRCILNENFIVYKNKNTTNIFDISGQRLQYSNISYGQFSVPLTLYLFGFHLPTVNSSPSTITSKKRIYYAKIWDNDMLVRHFVPVPRGLQIGDFVVPSNGMWDIVEQKFYGNMGTGDFIYGIDE